MPNTTSYDQNVHRRHRLLCAHRVGKIALQNRGPESFFDEIVVFSAEDDTEAHERTRRGERKERARHRYLGMRVRAPPLCAATWSVLSLLISY